MKSLVFISVVLLFMGFNCTSILGTDDELNVTIHITGFGGTTSGSSSWKRGYVFNQSDVTIKNVKVEAWTNQQSRTVSTSPVELGPGDKGNFYTGKLSGSRIKTNVIYSR